MRMCERCRCCSLDRQGVCVGNCQWDHHTAETVELEELERRRRRRNSRPECPIGGWTVRGRVLVCDACDEVYER